MKASGVTCVVGRSFARIFYRNCINLGLLALVAPEVVDAATDGATLEIDLDAAVARLGERLFALGGIHPFILEAVAAGGFVEWARAHPPAG